jgi:hypothetical protein
MLRESAAWVRVVTEAKSARVWTLDVTGARLNPVPSRLRNGVLSFDISPTFKTVWYQIECS